MSLRDCSLASGEFVKPEEEPGHRNRRREEGEDDSRASSGSLSPQHLRANSLHSFLLRCNCEAGKYSQVRALKEKLLSFTLLHQRFLQVSLTKPKLVFKQVWFRHASQNVNVLFGQRNKYSLVF